MRLRGATQPLINAAACFLLLLAATCGGHKQEVNERRNLRGGQSGFLCCWRRCSSTSQQNTLEIRDAAPPPQPFDMQMCTFIALAVILNEGTLIFSPFPFNIDTSFLRAPSPSCQPSALASQGISLLKSSHSSRRRSHCTFITRESFHRRVPAFEL